MNINKSSAGKLDCIEINPPTAAKCSVIWLHGLGADGNDFVPIAKELQLPADFPVRFIFPHAPPRPVTINQGYVMRAWFDITSFQIDQGVDEAGIQQSIADVNKLIAHEESLGMPTENIILAGFSQGALIALRTGLSYPKRLAGVIALSGYLPGAKEVIQATQVANRQLPLFLAHGTDDPIVPFVLGEATRKVLEQAGFPVSWHAYQRMPHSVCPQEIRDIREWIVGLSVQ